MDCYPCLTQVPKILPCSHTQSVECSKDPEEEYCLTKVVKVLRGILQKLYYEQILLIFLFLYY